MIFTIAIFNVATMGLHCETCELGFESSTSGNLNKNSYGAQKGLTLDLYRCV